MISRNQRPEHVAKVYALGMFDGVHIGHMALIQTAVRIAGERGTTCGVYTFDVHPMRVVCPERAPDALMSLDARLDLMESAGVDTAVVHTFDTQLASMPPHAFVSRVLHDALGAQCVVVGYDYSFGQGGAGTPATLELLAREAGICVQTLPPVRIDGAPVSSTGVRKALACGDVERAALLLGRRHFVRGTVARGRGVGRELGIPTANVSVPAGIALPMPGVYACEARWGSSATVPAVCNIGVRPTFDDQGRGVTLEVHVMGVAPDLYGALLTVEFAARLRDELRFASPSELVRQIEADMIAARRLLEP
ncbi:MAG TPA: riboflavin biosynthesis protein RibF [Bacillota bacterium]|nr:riboflavin biosynthesis protein RibF [Bacillota bacterium]